MNVHSKPNCCKIQSFNHICHEHENTNTKMHIATAIITNCRQPGQSPRRCSVCCNTSDLQYQRHPSYSDVFPALRWCIFRGKRRAAFLLRPSVLAVSLLLSLLLLLVSILGCNFDSSCVNLVEKTVSSIISLRLGVRNLGRLPSSWSLQC